MAPSAHGSTRRLVAPDRRAFLVSLVLLAATAGSAAGQVFKDPFSGPSIDRSIWATGTLGSGPSIGLSPAGLEFRIPGSSHDDPQQRVILAGAASLCRMSGDFDVRVDFEIVEGPSRSGVRLALNNLADAAVARVSGGPPESHLGECYLLQANGIMPLVLADDRTGGLRLARTGSVITGYYRKGGEWVAIRSDSVATHDVGVGLAAWTHDSVFARQDVRVAFRNLVVQRGQFLCPVASPGGGGSGGSSSCDADLASCAAALEQAKQANQSLTAEVERLGAVVRERDAEIARLGAVVRERDAEIARLKEANARLQADVKRLWDENQSLLRAIASALERVESRIRQVMRDVGFRIPGDTLLGRLDRLVGAIETLNPGRLRGIYKALGGRRHGDDDDDDSRSKSRK
jgi:hypothetical protein